jgi:hypothetical protein
VTKKGTAKGYTPGEQGAVLWVSEPGPDHPPYTVVQMRDDGPGVKPIVFLPDEIEPDV